MDAISKVLKDAQELSGKLASLVSEVSTEKITLAEGRKKLKADVDALADQTLKTKGFVDAVSVLDNAKATLARAEAIRIENNKVAKDLDERQLQAEAKEKKAVEAIGKLDREIFDFNESKRAHSVVRRNFEAEKATWEAKVKKLGLKLE
jgi:regulator of replication initiation timing